jgi:hypothetical protein
VATVNLYVVGFGRPDLLMEQGRLLRKYMRDDYAVCVVDNTLDEKRYIMQTVAESIGADYLYVEGQKHEHPDALNFAVQRANLDEFFGFLDHDIFPRRPVEGIIDTLKKVGFYGIGQSHAPTGRQYLWPGLCFFSRAWLGDRRLDFNGIRGVDKREDGDCGSGNWPLFADEDWRNIHGVLDHGYGFLRAPDAHGLQSFGYELMGPWIHLTNASNWMAIPNPEERDRLARELVESL